MKRILFVIAVIIVLVAAIVGVMILLLPHNQSVSSTNSPGSASSFPVSVSSSQGNTSSGSGSQTTASYSVENTQGGTISTKDFMNNPTTVVDKYNKDDYYLAGAPEYCSGGVCPSQTATTYYITYRKSANAFIIGLETEPLGQVRQQAEQYLMNSLGISETQMCNLNYYVLTTSDVNPVYANENLGFSFCPGAVQLPS